MGQGNRIYFVGGLGEVWMAVGAIPQGKGVMEAECVGRDSRTCGAFDVYVETYCSGSFLESKGDPIVMIIFGCQFDYMWNEV